MPPPCPRRSVLRVLATGALPLLAGCQAPGAASDDPSASQPASPTPDAPLAVEHLTVGERVGDFTPHAVEVWNAAAVERTVSTTVVDLTAGTTPVEQSLALPPNGSLELSLRTPHTYRLTITVPGTDLARTVQVTEASFDTCNEHRTTVRIGPETITVRSLSTDLLCVTPTEA